MEKVLAFISLCLLILIGGVSGQTPSIISFSPKEGAAGTKVTITGANFNTIASANIVYFGSVPATVLSASATKLEVAAPAGATFQPITVTTNMLGTQSKTNFYLTFGDNSADFLTSISFVPTNTVQRTMSRYSQVRGFFSHDLNLDGYPEMIVTEDQNDLRLYQHTGDPAAPFIAKPTLSLAIGYGSTSGDLNNDGKLDFAYTVTDWQGVSQLTIFTNTSDTKLSFKETKINNVGPINPYLKAADLDNDGRDDIINFKMLEISFLRNTTVNNILSFSPAAASLAYKGDRPEFTAVGFEEMIVTDLDSDGKLDLIARYSALKAGFYVYKNTSMKGTISFERQEDLSYEGYPSSIITGDVNGDGKPDLLVTNGSLNSLSIVKNVSTSSQLLFGTKTTYNFSSHCFFVALGELDGDGRPDIGVINYKELVVLKNTGSAGAIAFDKKMNYPIRAEASRLGFSDYDKNGKLDIAIADGSGATNYEPSISILINKFNQPFIKSFSTTTGPGGIDVLLEGSKFLGTSKVTIGNSAVTSFTVISDSQISMKVADHHAGRIAVSTSYGTAVLEGYKADAVPVIASFSPSTGPIGTAVQIQGASFSTVPSDNIVYFGGVRATVTAATTNSLAVTVPFGAGYNPISVTRNYRTGYSRQAFKVTHVVTEPSLIKTFANKMIIAGNEYRQIATADFDCDGYLDLVVSGQRANRVLRNTGNSATPFVEEGKLVLENLPGKISLADFDGDGKIDVVSPVPGAGMVCYRNTSTSGTISFVESNVPIEGSYSGNGIAFADFDQDGKMDVVITNLHYNTISVLLNEGSPGKIAFAIRKDFTTGAGVTGVCTGDFDGDGKSDIAVCNTNINTISLFRNLSVWGQLDFEDKKDFSSDAGPLDIATGDLDGDGKLDIVVCNYSLVASLGPFLKGFALRNVSTSGSISFAPKISFTTGEYAQAIKIADMDGDGLPDLVYADWYKGFIGMNRNKSVNGTLSFAAHVIIPVNDKALATLTEVVVGDWNNDGKPDIAGVGVNSSQLYYFINEGGPAPPPPLSKPVITADGPLIFTSGQQVNLRVAAVNGYTYQWIKNGNDIPGATALTFIAAESGIYQIRADQGNLSATSESLSVTVVFKLAANNFKASATGSSCMGQADGIIHVEAVQDLNYTAILTGDAMTTKTFTDKVEFGNLRPGTYTMCITVGNQPDYKQCFTLVVKEPNPLSVFSTVNEAGNVLKLSLSGSTNYYIELNGRTYTTSSDTFELPLKKGNNQLSVRTDRLCQGKVERLINTSGSPAPYPNPVEGTLYINLGDSKIKTTVLKVYEPASGKLVKSGSYTDRWGVVELELGHLAPGIYSLVLIRDGLQSVFKVMKK